MAPTLETDRLILRHWKNEDLEPFAVMNSDPRVMEFFPNPLSEKESDQLAITIQKELVEKKYGLWAIEVKGEASFIGFVGLHYPSFEAHFTPCIEIAWRLAYPHWGKGYAMEASSRASDYGLNELNLEEIVSFTASCNNRSIKVMEKLGMRHDPSENFEHSKLPEGHPLKLHVLYRLGKKR